MNNNFSFVFPGQGSQFVGMGKELIENKIAKEVFEEVNDTLGFDIQKICFEGPENILTLTENTQPAIMTVSIAIFRIFANLLGDNNINKRVKYIAGHSLGEYSALCINGVLSLKDTAKILYIRGKTMQDAMKGTIGKMAAILFTNIDEVNEFITDNNIDNCYIANDNGGGQVVISGSKDSIDYFLDLSKRTKKFKRIVPLKVSAAFHSYYMKNAVPVMQEAFNEINFDDIKIPLISNVTAKAETDVKILTDLLLQQLYSRVRWKESIEYAIKNGGNKFVEIGPSNVLSRLINKISSDVTAYNWSIEV